MLFDLIRFEEWRRRRQFQVDLLKNRLVEIEVIPVPQNRKTLRRYGKKDLRGDKVRQLEVKNSSEIENYSNRSDKQ
jgi:hypothetical protein